MINEAASAQNIHHHFSPFSTNANSNGAYNKKKKTLEYNTTKDALKKFSYNTTRERKKSLSGSGISGVCVDQRDISKNKQNFEQNKNFIPSVYNTCSENSNNA